MTLAASAGLAGAGLQLSGQYTFEINTTSIDGDIVTLDIDISTGRVRGLTTATIKAESVRVTASTYMWLDSGSAVLAGARFDIVDGEPVPVLSGANATIALNSPSELWIAGSVTSSGVMTLAAGAQNFATPTTSKRSPAPC